MIQLNSSMNGTINQMIRTAVSKELLLRHLRTPLYKNAYYLMASTMLTSIFSFLFWVVAARLYEPTAVGLAVAIISVSGLLALFSNLGLGLGLIRFLPGAGKDGSSMINTCFSLSGLTSVLLSLLFLTGLEFWSPSLLLVRQRLVFSIAFVVFALVSTLTPLVSCVFMARRSTRFIFTMSSISKFLNILLVIFFAAIFKSAFGIFISTTLVTSTALFIAVFWLIPKIQQGYCPLPMMKKEVISKIGSYSAGNYIARLFLQIPPLVFPIMVINVLGTEMNAYFYIAWSFFNILRVIPSSISNSLFAEGSNRAESFQRDTMRTLKLIVLLLLPALTIFLMMTSKVLLFFGQSYSQNGSMLLRIISVSIIPWSINYVYITIGRVRRNISSVIRVSVAIASFTLGLGYLLMLRMELIGAGIGWVLGQSIVAAVIALCLFRRVIPLPGVG